MELSSLTTVLKCISKFKLESSFSPAPLELRVNQLEKEMEENTNAESSLTGKDNLSNSENKGSGVALPDIDQPHLVIRKKHALSSIESQNQGKRLKVDGSHRSIS